MLLENGGNLLVLAGTEARDSTVGKGGQCKTWVRTPPQRLTLAGNIPLGGQKMSFRLWPGQKISRSLAVRQSSTQVRWRMHWSVARQEACLLMMPRDNVTPVKLEGAVRITDSATLTLEMASIPRLPT